MKKRNINKHKTREEDATIKIHEKIIKKRQNKQKFVRSFLTSKKGDLLWKNMN